MTEIILRVRPDILVLQKFDRDPARRALTEFADRLRTGIPSPQPAPLPGIDYGFLYQGPVNTGLPSGYDLDGDGRQSGPGDAHGYGRFPGQYAMAVLSRFPIDYDHIRTFQRFRWSAMPRADRPTNPDGSPFHADRIIDLSYAAAVKLGYMEKGTARVRVEVLAVEGVDDRRGASFGSYRFLQIGAFSSESSAQRLQGELQALVSAPVVVSRVDNAGGRLYRVRVGPVNDKAHLESVQRTLARSGYDAGQPLP